MSPLGPISPLLSGASPLTKIDAPLPKLPTVHLGTAGSVPTEGFGKMLDGLGELNQERLAEVGTMADADRMVAHLSDDDRQVRQLTEAALWRIWNRSGDRAIDAKQRRGVEQMEAGQLTEALQTFSEVVRRSPGWRCNVIGGVLEMECNDLFLTPSRAAPGR